MELIIMGIFMIISFFIGRYSKKDLMVEPKPVKKVKHNKKVETKEFIDPVAIMLQNIDNYNGTSVGQQDVPDEEEEW